MHVYICGTDSHRLVVKDTNTGLGAHVRTRLNSLISGRRWRYSQLLYSNVSFLATTARLLNESVLTRTRACVEIFFWYLFSLRYTPSGCNGNGNIQVPSRDYTFEFSVQIYMTENKRCKGKAYFSLKFLRRFFKFLKVKIKLITRELILAKKKFCKKFVSFIYWRWLMNYYIFF